jgi:D-alanyl-D-alanine carboxypeptidase/D-alanyl-D-alanine-endopeptidase (penicillin-binding protein 4)
MVFYVKITNRAKTVAQKAQASGPSYFRAEESNEIVLSGSMFIKDRPQSYSVAIHNPTSYFGTVLVETLAAEGIVVEGGFQEAEEALSGARCVHIHTSKLMPTLEVTNTNSQNFYAEMLCKYLGYRKKGLGTWENGTQAILEALRPMGVTDSLIVDGCGLSRRNRVRPADLLNLLVAARDLPDFDGFLETLAVSGGSEGTLKNRLREERTRGRVKAKTGHLAGADALSGYLFSSSGTVYAFSVLMNGQKSTADARKLMDSICEDLLER